MSDIVYLSPWWAASASRCLPLRCTSCTDLLAFLVPCEYPTAFAAGDGIVGYANDLTNVRNVHCFQRLAFGFTDIIVGIALCHEKVAAPPFQFTHATAREPANPLALLVIDVVPVLRLLDIRYLLPLRLSRHRQQ